MLSNALWSGCTYIQCKGVCDIYICVNWFCYYLNDLYSYSGDTVMHAQCSNPLILQHIFGCSLIAPTHTHYTSWKCNKPTSDDDRKTRQHCQTKEYKIYELAPKWMSTKIAGIWVEASNVLMHYDCNHVPFIIHTKAAECLQNENDEIWYSTNPYPHLQHQEWCVGRKS